MICSSETYTSQVSAREMDCTWCECSLQNSSVFCGSCDTEDQRRLNVYTGSSVQAMPYGIRLKFPSIMLLRRDVLARVATVTAPAISEWSVLSLGELPEKLIHLLNSSYVQLSTIPSSPLPSVARSYQNARTVRIIAIDTIEARKMLTYHQAASLAP